MGPDRWPDFFTAEVWTPTGLKTYYVLFMIKLETRRVHLAGFTRNPDDMFMGRARRNGRRLRTGPAGKHRLKSNQHPAEYNLGVPSPYVRERVSPDVDEANRS